MTKRDEQDGTHGSGLETRGLQPPASSLQPPLRAHAGSPRQSRSDDSVQPGAQAPGGGTDNKSESPPGVTLDSARADIAPAGLDADDVDRCPGADAPGFTMPPVPGCETRCHVDEAALVDFGDGELSEAEAQNLEAHLTQCPRCRQHFAALRASLSIAQDIWRDAAAVTLQNSPGHRRYRWQAIAAAASVAAAVLIGCWWMAAGQRPHAQIPRQVASEADVPRTSSPTRDASTNWTDIEESISLQVRSARLAASARVLADDPQLKTYHDNAQRYLANALGEGVNTGTGNTGIEQEI